MSKVKQAFAKAKEKIRGLKGASLSEEQFQRFDRSWRLLKGRTDIKSKLMLLLNPDKPQTTTFLNRHQAHYTALSFFMKDRWEEFKPMEDYALQLCLSALGVEGKGIDSSVRLTGALSESKVFERLGITMKREEK